MANRLCGIYLILVAVVVAVQTVTEPVYIALNIGDMYGPVWGFLDYFMALAIALGIYFGCKHKSAVDDEGDDAPVSREFVITNALFYGFIFIAILFFWNWFHHLSPGTPSMDGGNILLVWLLVDAALPLLAGATGIRLLRRNASDGVESEPETPSQ